MLYRQVLLRSETSTMVVWLPKKSVAIGAVVRSKDDGREWRIAEAYQTREGAPERDYKLFQYPGDQD